MATLRYDKNWGDPDLGYGGWNCPPTENCWRSCMIVSGNNGSAQDCMTKCQQACSLKSGIGNRPFIPGSISTLPSVVQQSKTMRVGMSGMGETLTNGDACYKNTSDVSTCYYCYASSRGLGAKDVNGAGKYIFDHCMSKAGLKRNATSSIGMSIAPKQVGVSDMMGLSVTGAVPLLGAAIGAYIGYNRNDEAKGAVIGGLVGWVATGVLAVAGAMAYGLITAKAQDDLVREQMSQGKKS